MGKYVKVDKIAVYLGFRVKKWGFSFEKENNSAKKWVRYVRIVPGFEKEVQERESVL